jgi:hypothetical protein
VESFLFCSVRTEVLYSILTRWSRVLLEKLTGLQLVKKFPAFYGTRRFITAFISAQPNSVHTPTYHFLKIHPNIILPSIFGSYQWSLSLRFPHQNPVHASLFPNRATLPAHLILLDFVTHTIVGGEYRSWSFSWWRFLHFPVTLSLLGPNILLNTMLSNTLSLRSSFSVSDQVSHPYKTIGKIIVLCVLNL